MRHIIFGGDGFIGHVLAQKLIERGELVIVADINKSPLPHYSSCDYLHIDITKRKDFTQLKLQPTDIVYNLAAAMLYPVILRDQRKTVFHSVNAKGTYNILQAMERSGTHKLIHISSDLIYGHAQTPTIYEDHPFNPLGEYARSKVESENYVAQWCKEQGRRATILRPCLTIGPGRIGMVEQVFKLIHQNRPVPLIGGGKNLFQFISVYDCVEAILCASEAGCPNEAYNLASNSTPTVHVLLKKLIKKAQSKSILLPVPAYIARPIMQFMDFMDTPVLNPEQYLIMHEDYILNCEKANRELNWQAQTIEIDTLVSSFFEYRNKNRNIDDQDPIQKAIRQI